MKTTLFFLSLAMIFFSYSCEQEDETVEQPVVMSQPAAATSTSGNADEACSICAMELEIIAMENKIGLLFRDIKRREEMKRLQSKMDSMNVVFNQRITPYNGDINQAKKVCSEKYNINQIQDTVARNKAYAQVFVWYFNTAFPSFDTTCYVPVIKNGKYEVHHKGEVKLMSKAEHDNYMKTGVDFTNEVKVLYDENIRKAINGLTGLPIEKIDELCISVVGQMAWEYRFHPQVEKLKASDEQYKKYMKLQTDFWGDNY